MAKIVFQKKAFYLGSYDAYEDAVTVRKNAEAVLFEGAAEFYRKWKKQADADPEWAENNPVRFEVQHDRDQTIKVSFFPELPSTE